MLARPEPTSNPAPRHRFCLKENYNPKKITLGQKLKTSSLIFEPIKLKLYAILMEQKRQGKVSQRYFVSDFKHLDTESCEKLLLKELFNWTEEALKADEQDLEIIIADKFTVVNSENDTFRDSSHREATVKTLTEKQDSGSFDQLVDSRYEEYKRRFEAKSRFSNQMSKSMAKTVNNRFLMTQRATTIDINFLDEDAPKEQTVLTASDLFNNVRDFKESWTANSKTNGPHNRAWMISKVNDIDSFDESDSEQVSCIKTDGGDRLNGFALSAIEETSKIE